jgi:RNA recognition motif-containing protein
LHARVSSFLFQIVRFDIKIIVNNLPSEVTEEDLREEFKVFGEVISIIIPRNRFDSRGKGYCFVEMLKAEDTRLAVQKLNGKTLKGQVLKVEAARNWSQFGK